MPTILQNMACYLECLPLEAAAGPTTSTWSAVLQQLEILYRRILLLLNTIDDIAPLLKIMICVFKIPTVSQHKVKHLIIKLITVISVFLTFQGVLEPFSKVLSHAIQTHILRYNYLVEICFLCNRAFTKVSISL